AGWRAARVRPSAGRRSDQRATGYSGAGTARGWRRTAAARASGGRVSRWWESRRAAIASRGSVTIASSAARRLVLQVPAEVDLHLRDPLAVEREDLGVAAAAAVAVGQLVGDDHLPAGLHHPHEADALARSGARPPAIEVAGAVEPDVERAREPEPLGEAPLDRRAVAHGEGFEDVADHSSAVSGRHGAPPVVPC